MNPINVRKFIQENYTPYDGDERFLAAPTARTLALWDEVKELMRQRARGRRRAGLSTRRSSAPSPPTPPATSTSDLEQIVGLQTDKPLKRSIMPFGGIRVVRTSVEEHGGKLDPMVETIFQYRKTHNDGVFDVYTDEMQNRPPATSCITGLPDAYGRGRIIGDYRRVALYGVDFLIEQKKQAVKQYVHYDMMRRPDPQARRAERADPRPAGAERNGRQLRLRHFRPRPRHEGGHPVAVFRLSGRHQGAKRRGHVAWAAPPPSWTSTPSGIWPPGHTPKSRFRNWWTTSS